MVIPKHAEISDADGSHEGTDHLVELARRRSQNAPERRVSHVKKRFYRRFRHRVALSLTLNLVRRHRLEPPLTSILELARRIAKRGVSRSNSWKAQTHWPVRDFASRHAQ